MGKGMMVGGLQKSPNFKNIRWSSPDDCRPEPACCMHCWVWALLNSTQTLHKLWCTPAIVILVSFAVLPSIQVLHQVMLENLLFQISQTYDQLHQQMFLTWLHHLANTHMNASAQQMTQLGIHGEQLVLLKKLPCIDNNQKFLGSTSQGILGVPDHQSRSGHTKSC